jgi:hypothetical protein
VPHLKAINAALMRTWQKPEGRLAIVVPFPARKISFM